QARAKHPTLGVNHLHAVRPPQRCAEIKDPTVAHQQLTLLVESARGVQQPGVADQRAGGGSRFIHGAVMIQLTQRLGRRNGPGPSTWAPGARAAVYHRLVFDRVSSTAMRTATPISTCSLI